MKPHLSLAVSLAAAACSSGSPASSTVDSSTPVDSSASHDGSGSPSDASLDSNGQLDAAPWNEDAEPGDGGDTWASWVDGFFMKYCVPCHNPSGPPQYDFTNFSNVLSLKDIIRCGIATPAQIEPSYMCVDGGFPPPEQFPLKTSTVQPPPTDAERARIIAWINAGCP